jgi:hypothetical protein
MENVINNTESMPPAPQGTNGKWEWDGHTTARHRSVDGQEWLLKGAWRWVQEQKQAQAPLADKPVAFIAKQFKPTSKDTIKMDKAFNNLFILCGAIIAITLTLMIIIN